MTDDGNPREIKASSVICAGSDSGRHEPRKLDLPENVTVRCPDCGREYRRAAEWSPVWRARWPSHED